MNDGTDINITIKNEIKLSIQVFRFSAATTPASNPNGIEINKEKKFNTTVGGILVAIRLNTSAPGLIFTDVPKLKSVMTHFRKYTS